MNINDIMLQGDAGSGTTEASSKYYNVGENNAATADAALASIEGFWLAPQNIAIALTAAAALSIAGYALGMKMLGKHFKPAGVA